jgi:DNA-directed RNA polymerase subunit N (RpoN/RPB10)
MPEFWVVFWEQVFNESQREVNKANDMIEQDVDAAVLEIVLNRYCTRIMLLRFMIFVDQKAKEGVLQRSEARRFLTDAETQVQKGIADSMDKINAQLKLDRSSRRQSTYINENKKMRFSSEQKSEFSTEESISLLPNT